MIVLDSSAALDFALGERNRASWIEGALDSAGWDLHAPHVIDIELVSTIRRIALGGRLLATDAREALDLLIGLGIQRYPHVSLVDRMWDLRDAVHPPDSAFIALAEALDAPLLTTDPGLARTHGHGATIISP